MENLSKKLPEFEYTKLNVLLDVKLLDALEQNREDYRTIVDNYKFINFALEPKTIESRNFYVVTAFSKSEDSLRLTEKIPNEPEFEIKYFLDKGEIIEDGIFALSITEGEQVNGQEVYYVATDGRIYSQDEKRMLGEDENQKLIEDISGMEVVTQIPGWMNEISQYS